MKLKAVWDTLPLSAKVLLYLHTVQDRKMWAGRQVEERDLTQNGIAASLGVSVPRLSKVTAPMVAAGELATRRVRIPNVRRSPLAFSLTEKGAKLAGEKARELFSMKVRFTSLDGSETETDLGLLSRTLGLQSDVAAVLRSARGSGPEALEYVKDAAAGGEEQRFPKPELVDLRDALQISRSFVGRKKELAELNEFLTASPARLFCLIGPAAMGKTSLISRFVQGAMKTAPVAFHTCREWDTLRNVLEPIAELLARMGRRRLQYVLQGELRPITIQDASEILRRDLKGVGALMILDDVQKLTFDHRPLLRLLLTTISGDEPAPPGEPGGPLKVVKVVTASREPLTGVFDHRDLILKELVREMELKGLSQEECGELLEKEKATGLPAEKVHQMTGGHPLYIELITRSGLSGAVRDFRKFVSSELMGRLSPDERAVLGCLTVFRMPVPFTALQIPQANPEILDRLVKLGLVNETSPEEYEVLDIVEETLYRSLRNEDRRLYHGTAARYLRGLRSDEKQAEAIHHLLRAEEVLPALELASENIKSLIRLGRNALVDEVLEASKEVELPTRGVVAGSKLRSEMALAAGEWRIAQIHLEKALAAVRGDPLQEGRILAAQAQALREQAEPEEALKKYFEAEVAAKSVYDLPTLAGVYRGIGKLYWRLADFEKAMDYLKRSLDFLRAAEMGAEHGETLLEIGLVHSRMGQTDRAIEYYDRAVEDFKKGNWIFPLARAYNNLGVEHLDKGDIKKATFYWKNAAETWKQLGNKHGLAITYCNLSDPYSRLKKFKKAKEYLDRASGLAEDTGDKVVKALVLSNYGQLNTKLGRWPEAFRFFEESLSISKGFENPYEHAFTLFEYGKALALSGDTEGARARLEQALGLFERCDAKVRVKEVSDLLSTLGPTRRPAG